MPRAPLQSVLLLSAVIVAGCGPRPGAPGDEVTAASGGADRRPPSRSGMTDGARRAAGPAAVDARGGAAADAGTRPVGAWHLQESFPPRAVWGVPAGEGLVTVGCDRGAGQLVLDRQAIGVADGVRVVTLDADGVRMDYPAERRDDALAPVLVTRIALDAPILDRLLLARRAAFVAGDDTITTTAPGASLQAVVDACRRESGR